jgi:hypothetical protein
LVLLRSTVVLTGYAPLTKKVVGVFVRFWYAASCNTAHVAQRKYNVAV